jgi:hypothetical protein
VPPGPPNPVVFIFDTIIPSHLTGINWVEGKPVSYNPRDMKPEPGKFGRSMERHMDSIGSALFVDPHAPFYCSFVARKSI